MQNKTACNRRFLAICEETSRRYFVPQYAEGLEPFISFALETLYYRRNKSFVFKSIFD